jgi:HSP20 family molecular chaperone IbpA
LDQRDLRVTLAILDHREYREKQDLRGHREYKEYKARLDLLEKLDPQDLE